ncbi:DUF6702 family protein [Solitalea lacus]|uniref:DUF6702 family protein n=1 Tax=Solitalea lacus TaxID=2911172 RepID=UPI001EDC1CF4|nr:DUF6702 family protein [Solitalea lacus]UKJ08988.1 hypothetical protein L2B55_07415 [Solitalea lacus]
MKKLLFILLFLLISIKGHSHKFYTSMTQMEYNSQNKSVEVIMNIFWDDVEAALNKKYKKKLTVGSKEFTACLRQYLTQTFQIKNSKSQLKPFEFIGTEINGMTLSVYLEIPLPEGLQNAELQNSVLIDDFEGQTNIVNITSGKAKRTLLFKEGECKKKIVF